MLSLALANILHRPLRSSLSALAVAIGVAMLLVMLGLSHGTLDEVARRMQSVDAELVIIPQQESVIFTAGASFSDKYIPLIEAVEVDGRRVVQAVIPVFLDTVRLGGQQQRLFGIRRRDLPAFLGHLRIVSGRLFDEDGRFAALIASRLNAAGRYDPATISPQELADGCELVIDTRLARTGRFDVGDVVSLMGHEFRIVGIVEAGVAGRVMAPIETLRHIKNGGVPWSSMFFVKLTDPALAERAADAIAEAVNARVELKSNYGQLLFESFSQIYTYINAASAVSLLVCFIIILLAMYTMVLERTRDIGILKSLGASRSTILAGTLIESLAICVTGTLAGIGLAFAGKLAIEALRPLLTVDITARWLVLALAIGVGGGAASALYPGYRAARLDPVAALSFE